MPVGTCDQCQKESTFLDLFAGMRLKCKLCPTGYVTLPPKAGAEYAKPIVTAAPVPKPVTAPVVPPIKSIPRPTPTLDDDGPPPEILAMLSGEQRPGVKWQYTIMYLLIVIGLASAFFDTIGLHFTIIACLDPVQPFAGLLMAIVGFGLLIQRIKRVKSGDG